MAETSYGVSLAQGAGSSAVNGAVGGLVGQLLGGWNARRQWKYQKKQMALQQKYALEQMAEQSRLQRAQFDYENEYNSPVNVFNRFRQAGINPAAVLGSSGASLSASMPMPGAPSGGHVSGGPAIGAGTPGSPADAVAASQIKLNNAAAENQQSSANLSDEKAVTEQSVRNMLAATVDEKVMNSYFTHQKALYQGLVNSKTPAMLDAQIAQLTAHADQLVASGNLSEAQIELIREQTANVFFDSQLKKAMTESQSALAGKYRSESGFISLQSEDLRENIKSLRATQTFTTYEMNADGKAVPHTYEVDGYNARAMSIQFGAMEGAARAAVEAIRADWENPRQWNEAIKLYWDGANNSLNAIGQLILNAKKLPIAQQNADARSAGSVTTKEILNADGEVVGGTHTVRRPYRP